MIFALHSCSELVKTLKLMTIISSNSYLIFCVYYREPAIN